ncbi:transposase family protein [Psychrobacter sp. CAL346-MNA-CIBAN-0220]|uniref:helix-turn-helix domain-containing protein n=1 Tax=Psychrobacter sp. CAL346-MNA-CIBAN-0220 TaxID=3140457 RepID=UPI003317CC35
MQQHDAAKTKVGRLDELSLKVQIMLVLTYWRAYRTLYHIGMDFGLYESSSSRIVHKIKDIIID